MALTNPYCQVADVRSQLTDADAQLDQTMIEKAVGATSRAIDRYCGRRFWRDPVPVTRLFDADHPHTLIVPDIAAAEGVVVELDTGQDGSFASTLDAADYQLLPLNAAADGGAYSWWRITLVGGLRFQRPCRGRPGVRVTATWGWSQIPDEVVEAAVIKAVALFKSKDAPFGIAGFNDFGSVRISREDPRVMTLLAPYMLPKVG